jgi:hypothetical protein
MKTYKNHIFPFALITILALVLTGCGMSNTVASCIISHQQYTEKGDLEKAKQPEQLTAGKDIYACVCVIESSFVGLFHSLGQPCSSAISFPGLSSFLGLTSLIGLSHSLGHTIPQVISSVRPSSFLGPSHFLGYPRSLGYFIPLGNLVPRL